MNDDECVNASLDFSSSSSTASLEDQLDLSSTSSPPSSSSEAASPTLAPKRKRGRPCKPKPPVTEEQLQQNLTPSVPRKRGRPPGSGKKNKLLILQNGLVDASVPDPIAIPATGSSSTECSPLLSVKRGRGRPRKYPKASSSEDEMQDYFSGNPFTFSAESEDEFEQVIAKNFASFTTSKKSPPSDLEIANLIKDYSNEFVSEGCSPYEVVTRLEEHFGADLQSRFWYITEVYNVLCF